MKVCTVSNSTRARYIYFINAIKGRHISNIDLKHSWGPLNKRRNALFLHDLERITCCHQFDILLCTSMTLVAAVFHNYKKLIALWLLTPLKGPRVINSCFRSPLDTPGRDHSLYWVNDLLQLCIAPHSNIYIYRSASLNAVPRWEVTGWGVLHVHSSTRILHETQEICTSQPSVITFSNFMDLWLLPAAHGIQ